MKTNLRMTKSVHADQHKMMKHFKQDLSYSLTSSAKTQTELLEIVDHLCQMESADKMETVPNLLLHYRHETLKQ